MKNCEQEKMLKSVLKHQPFPGYLQGVAALVIIGLIFDFFGTFLTGLGLRSTDPNKKYKYYRVAIYALIIACK